MSGVHVDLYKEEEAAIRWSITHNFPDSLYLDAFILIQNKRICMTSSASESSKSFQLKI